MDKSDRRRLELLPKPLDFEEFVVEMENISGLMAEQKGLRFDLERLTDLPRCIEVDSTRLRQVLWNLVSNATKFTKDGGVVLSVSSETVDQQAEITFEVEDSGIGIPSSELDKIFAMYYQVKEGSDNLHAVGTGIGLAVSRQLVQMMGGDITVSSEVGEGSTFTVTIRVPLVEKVEEEEVMPAIPQVSLNIFMVEDIELNITVAKALLESLGHEVTIAMRGDEALEKFDPEAYDLVLLDIQLPDMSGFDIARTLREKYDYLPALVALTANVIKDKAEYLEKGMDDALSKPLSVKAITEVIQRLVLTCPIDEDEEMEDLQPEPENTGLSEDMVNQLLDLEMLSSYVEIVGTKPVYDSIAMFEEKMPEYIEILDSNMTAKDKDGIKFEAHKIKGAAGSIGLKHIQQVAQKAQSPELPAWWENINDWVDEIKDGYQNDLNVLKGWLASQEKS
jgi:two-component system aerobic respiration control sensor histidine kinase ArcB